VEQLQSAFGALALVAIAFALGENRRKVRWRSVVIALALTVALAILFLRVPILQNAFSAANDAVNVLARATRAGSSFVFGYIGGGAAPFTPTAPGRDFVLAFQALPTVIVLSVLTTLLFYWRILPAIVRGFGFVLQRTIGVGGAVGLSAAANIFVGTVEAPLFIRPYLARLTRSEMFIIITCGMASIAGSVLVVYATILGPTIAAAGGHIIVASVLSAPAAIAIALVMVPETAEVGTEAETVLEPVAESTMDAIVKGAEVGLQLMLTIIAMLIAFVALAYLANAILGLLPPVAGAPITLERMLGIVMAPVCWLMGIPWAEAPTAGSLLGIKTVLTEFVAYLGLAVLPPDALSPRSRLIMLYALCGFANFASVGIIIGGLAVIVPERRAEISELAVRSIVSGTLTTCLLGAIVGMLTA
jgi:CNT family concentrative nucleoside transporter